MSFDSVNSSLPPAYGNEGSVSRLPTYNEAMRSHNRPGSSSSDTHAPRHIPGRFTYLGTVLKDNMPLVHCAVKLEVLYVSRVAHLQTFTSRTDAEGKFSFSNISLPSNVLSATLKIVREEPFLRYFTREETVYKDPIQGPFVGAVTRTIRV
jgi:hypothetical protein